MKKVSIIIILLTYCLLGCKKTPKDLEIYHSPGFTRGEHLILYKDSVKIYERQFETTTKLQYDEPVLISAFDYNSSIDLKVICNNIDSTFIFKEDAGIHRVCIYFIDNKIEIGTDLDGNFFKTE